MAFPRYDHVHVALAGHMVTVQIPETEGPVLDDAKGVPLMTVAREFLTRVGRVQQIQPFQAVQTGERGVFRAHCRPMAEAGRKDKMVGTEGNACVESQTREEWRKRIGVEPTEDLSTFNRF